MVKKRTTQPGSGEQPGDPRVDQPVEQLVTVESQREFDLFSGQRAERTFLKMYVAARTSGLLATISDRDWKTLCTLATYMDADGYCFPSQAELARALGCSRQMANERVNSLARFHFQGQPVLLVEKQRDDGGKWARNGYRVLPIASLGIFDQPGEHARPHASKHDGRRNNRLPKQDSPLASSPEARRESTVSRNPDMAELGEGTVSSGTVTVRLDTNKNQLTNQISLSNIRKTSTKTKRGNAEAPEISTDPRGQAAAHAINPTHATASATAETAHAAAHHQPESVTMILQRRRPPPQDEAEDRQVIGAYLEDFAREFRDRASLKHSVSRAANLYRQSGRSREVFIAAMYQARAKTKEATKVQNRMAYWFSCLADVLGLKDPLDRPPAAE